VERGGGRCEFFSAAFSAAFRALCFPLVALSGIDRAARSYGGLQVREITEESASECRTAANRRGKVFVRSHAIPLFDGRRDRKVVEAADYALPLSGMAHASTISPDNGQTRYTRRTHSVTRALEHSSYFASDVRVEYWRSVELKLGADSAGLSKPKADCRGAPRFRRQKFRATRRQRRRSSLGNRYS